MATDTLGVLIHGAGWVSTQHIKAFQTNPFTRVVAISSRRLSSCQTRAEEAGLEDIGLYDDYDAAAAAAGKHIAIEKPVANSLEEMASMGDVGAIPLTPDDSH